MADASESTGTSLAELWERVFLELNHFIFFDSMVRLFRSNNIGEAKTRAIIRAMMGCGKSYYQLRMLRRADVIGYRSSDAQLFVREKLRGELLALCDLYEMERAIVPTALVVSVELSRARPKTGAPVMHVVVVNLTSGKVLVRLPQTIYRRLHSIVHNHRWLKYLALLAAIRWEMSDLRDEEFFTMSDGFCQLIAQCSRRYDAIDVDVGDGLP